MQIIKKKYQHYIIDNLNLEVTLDKTYNFNLYIVYYINCLVNNNYLSWIYNHINQVKDYKSSIYIICTINKNNEDFLKQQILDSFGNLNITIEINYENAYEYPGILKVWNLAKIHPKSTDLILYFHSKGISHYKSYREKKNKHIEAILQDLDYIYEIFSVFPSITKVCVNSAGYGWGWFNYWFSRGSYLSNLEKPIKTTRRHYYEDWLGRFVSGDTISSNNTSEGYCYPNSLINCYQINKMTCGNIGYFLNIFPTKIKIIPRILQSSFNLIDVIFHEANNIKRGINVTEKANKVLKKQLSNFSEKSKQPLYLTASNFEFGDPCQYIVKQLIIKYRLNDKIIIKTLEENDTHNFTEHF